MIRKLMIATVLAGSAVAAQAAPIVLDFENIHPVYPHDPAIMNHIQDYYNGGTSSLGTSGTNYGVSFSPNAAAVCLNDGVEICSSGSRGGLSPYSATGALSFFDGTGAYMNVAAGFDTGFSFFYTSPVTTNTNVSVYSGLDGTGDLLGSFDLAQTAGSGCDPIYWANFCPFFAAGVAFDGIARSVLFSGTANQLAFDDITFGSATPITPGAVPEPATWAMLIMGFGLVGSALRRQGRKATVTA